MLESCRVSSLDAVFSLCANADDLRGRTGRAVGIVGPNPSANGAQNRAWAEALKALGVDAAYLPLDLAPSPDPSAALARLLAAWEPASGLVGLKVAPPYKEACVALRPDAADGAAKRLGCANTLARRGGRTVSANTDGEGMRLHLEESFGPLAGRAILIVGAGGAATGIVDALAASAGRIVIANRTEAKAAALAAFALRNHPAAKISAVSLAGLGAALAGAEVVVNTTSVGRQGPLEGFSALCPTELSPADNAAASALLLDGLKRPIAFASTLYRPERELLLRQAEERGHRVANGLGMWLYQAAAAAKDLLFPDELATVPVGRVAAALRAALEAQETPRPHAH